jgi:PPK2 family polyphosphate:nucleotide phosphotransferase
MSLSDELRSLTTLADVDPRDTPGFSGKKAAGVQALADMGDELADLQERLFAQSTQGGKRSVLVVLQGMDTSGKGGTTERLARALNACDVAISSFKKPSEEELAHDFLWRIDKALPVAGRVGIFDRSHYEDVLIVRVHQLQPPAEIERRYEAINDFEKRYVDEGGTILKCLLHIDKETQKERLAARLEDPSKYWKYNPEDVDERQLWDSYAESYQLVLDRCSTDIAPWHIVPAGRKWYRNWAVSQLMLETLRGLQLEWPPADFDIEAEKARLAAS